MVRRALMFAVSVAFLAAVSCRPHEGSVCNGKSDGVYRDPSDGKLFYVCVDGGSVLRMSCENGETFDEALKACVGGRKIEGGETRGLIDGKEGSSDGLPGEDVDSRASVVSKTSPIWEEDGVRGISKYKVYNIRLKKNIFPRSLLIIGKANREQKNV